MVSLILYHITVSKAIINTASTCTTEFIDIQIPYIPAGKAISKSIVKIVITHKSAGEIRCLIAANAKRIYIAINTTPHHNAITADFFIYAPILGQIIDCSRMLSAEAITLFSTKVDVSSLTTCCTCASSVSCN